MFPKRPGTKSQEKKEADFYILDSQEKTDFQQAGNDQEIKPVIDKAKATQPDLSIVDNLSRFQKQQEPSHFVQPQQIPQQTIGKPQIKKPKLPNLKFQKSFVFVRQYVLKPIITIALTILVVLGLGSGTLYTQTNSFDLLNTAYQTSSDLKTNADSFDDFQTVLNELLGQQGPKKYMIIFMNPAEARPASGFSGNFGMIEFNKGKVTDLWVKDIYSVRFNMPKAEDPYSPAPDTLDIIGNHQKFSDANWYADFSLTAKNIQEVYSLYDGWETDGVISVDPYIFIDMLKFTGPIEMSEYDTTFNAENFWETLHYKIEIDNDFKRWESTDSPKKILHDFVPKLLNRIASMPLDQKMEMIKKIYQDFQQKHGLIFFNNHSAEEAAKRIGMAGEIKNSNGDYLNVVKSNFENKSGYKVEQSIQLNSNLDALGILDNELKITHKNNASKEFPEGTHYSLLTIYLPKNVKFINAYIGSTVVKPAIFFESDKKVLGFRDFNTLPGKTNQITIKYQVDLELDSSKENLTSFMFQKQAGISIEDFEYNLIIDPIWEVVFENQQNNQNNIYKFNNRINNDLLVNFSLNK